MHVKKTALFAATVGLALPATAVADYGHVVVPGETLTSVAATDGLSVSALAGDNGLSARAELVVGQVLNIPPRGRTTAASRSAGSTPTAVSTRSTSSSSPTTSLSPSVGRLYLVQPGDSLSAIAARIGTTPAHLAAINGVRVNGVLLAGSHLMLPGSATGMSSVVRASDVSSATTSSSSGGTAYQVQVGDTLSAIAAASGTTVAHLAALNGLNPNGVLLAGSTLTLPSGSSLSTTATSASTASTSTSGAATGSGNQQIAGDTSSGPYPTAETVSSSQVGTEAAAQGLSPSLAEAIGWQESGFNNDLVSSDGAVGVMQIEPATWAWINQALTPGAPLNPSSAYDNVKGGALLLHSLVAQTGSDSAAAAAYYQGLSSVERNGEYADTQQYVADIKALQARFGG